MTHAPFSSADPRKQIPFRNFADRWAWTSNPTNGMEQMWTGSSTGGADFDAAKRLLHAGKSMQNAASVYSYDPAMLPNE
jgi:hypothetical protein